MNLSRRESLFTALAVTPCLVPLVSSVSLGAAQRMPLTATIAVRGQSPVTFSESTGTDLGRYVDPRGRFIQRCIRAVSPAMPSLTVQFRPDEDGSREEVVFELGRLFDGVAPFSMNPYRTVIARGGNVLADVALPAHYYRSRWRWQSAPRPVTVKTSDLIAAGLLPQYNEALTGGFTPASSVRTYSPMGLAGLTGYMPTTGERPDIGPVTEWQADYICTGRNLSTLLAQAEASGTIPWHHRDENTGAPLDTYAYPKASMYDDQNPSPFLPRDWLLNDTLNPDAAHEPALAYLPFLLTGDPYFLEELHFAVNFNILSQPWSARTFNIYFAVRAHAWSLRSVAQAARVTPDILPAWFLPKSYFVRHLSDNRDWMLAKYVRNRAEPWATFRTIEQGFGDNDESPTAPSGTYIAPWMEDFEAFILGWVVQMGFEDWRPVFEWKIPNTIGRTNGTSGWVRAWPTAYRQLLRPSRTGAWLSDWTATWALTQQRYGLRYVNPNTLAISGNDVSYHSITRSVLAIAERIGVAEAKAPHDWIGNQIRGLLTSQRWVARKWCVST